MAFTILLRKTHLVKKVLLKDKHEIARMKSSELRCLLVELVSVENQETVRLLQNY